MTWAELSLELGVLRVHGAADKVVSVLGDCLTVSSLRICFPIDYDCSSLADSWTVVADALVFRLPAPLTLLQLHQVYSERGELRSYLFEDWRQPVHCGACQGQLFEGLAPHLLPSSTWGFEDMRVCEECAPLQPKRHNRSSDILFVGEDAVWVRDARCPHCGCNLGNDESRQYSEKSVIRSLVDGEWTRVAKSQLGVWTGETPCDSFKPLGDCLLFVDEKVYRVSKGLQPTETVQNNMLFTLGPEWSPISGSTVVFVPQSPKLFEL